MTHIGLISINLFTLMRKGTKYGRIVMRLEINQVWKIVRNDPHRVDFHKFVYPNYNKERNQIWQNCYEVRNQPSLVDIRKTVRNDPHWVDFHKFVYSNEERNQIWQNCYEVRNQPSLVDISIKQIEMTHIELISINLSTLMRKGTKSSRIVMRLEINQVW